jgi:hypothetical protein
MLHTKCSTTPKWRPDEEEGNGMRALFKGLKRYKKV